MDRNKAIEIVKSHYPANKQMLNEALEFLIPELKESEEERIKKVLVGWFKRYKEEDTIGSEKFNGISTDSIIAWLEKQGEQSSNILWHDVNEEPEELREIFCEWETNDATWHDVTFYHTSTKKFFDGERRIDGVVKWAYVDEMLEKQCEPQAKDFDDFINKLSLQFPEVSFAKISRIAARVKKYLEQCNISNAQSNCIWHTADVAPLGSSDKQILVLFADSYAMVVPVEDWESLDKPLKWAFISDLIR